MVSLTTPATGSLDWGDAVNQNFTDIEGAVNQLSSLPGQFGDGSDGSATISSNTSLSRDMYYTTLTVSSSAVLTTNGFKIYAKTSVTINSGCTIRNNGANASGGSGGAGGAEGTLTGGGDGGGGSGNDTFNSLGGDGATGSSSGGTANRATSDYGDVRGFLSLLTGLFFTSSDNAAVSGGAGGGSGSGGGGGGGGVVLIATKSLVNDGAIEAKGGNGNGTGGGGGGGVVILAYESKSGSGTTSVAGGTGGTGVGAGTILEVSA